MVFNTVSPLNRTQTDGVEMLYTYRDHPMHNGGEILWMVGGRYVRFDDEFAVVGLGGVLGQSAWDTMASNRIWGPEVGVRWSKEFGRFGISSEGRFMAGINDQAIRQNGELASDLFGTRAECQRRALLDARHHLRQFGASDGIHPIGGVPRRGPRATDPVDLGQGRLDRHLMDSIARASDMVFYQVPNMGILSGNNKQPVFMQGFNVGLELNH